MQRRKRDPSDRKICAAFLTELERDIWQTREGPMNDVNEPNESSGKFFPSGAIFFFAALLVFYALLWLVIYGLMIARS